MTDVVRCTYCARTVAAHNFVMHCRVTHGVVVDIARWADGAPAVVDTTLSPADFGGAA